MSTELSIYDRIPDPMAAVKQLGHAIASSQMFGASTPTQGEIFALECLVRRVPPLMLAEKYHVIFGKLSKKYDAMLAEFNQAGGKHRIVERSAEVAEVELIWEGQPNRFRFTWEQAKKEPFVYEAGKGVKESDVIDKIEKGEPLTLKAKYRTERSRTQMLWARVISDAVRSVWPSANCGAYTPEEIDDFEEPHAQVAKATNGNGSKPKQSQPAVQTPAPGTEADDGVIEGEIVQEDGEIVKASVEPANGMCSAAQSTQVKELWGELGATIEQINEMLKARNVTAVRMLTSVQADELIAKLKAVLAKRVAASPEAAMDDAALLAGIRERLKQVNQVHPGTVVRVTEKLRAAGMATLDDLSRKSAEELYAALGGHDIEAFWGAAIFVPRSAKN